MQVTVAKPAEACGPLENDVKGKAVLVRRGSCPFVKKAEEVQAAGGRVMVVGSIHPYILRMVRHAQCIYSIFLSFKWNNNYVVLFTFD